MNRSSSISSVNINACSKRTATSHGIGGALLLFSVRFRKKKKVLTMNHSSSIISVSIHVRNACSAN